MSLLLFFNGLYGQLGVASAVLTLSTPTPTVVASSAVVLQASTAELTFSAPVPGLSQGIASPAPALLTLTTPDPTVVAGNVTLPVATSVLNLSHGGAGITVDLTAVIIEIGGTIRTNTVEVTTLSIEDILDEAPNTCRFRIDGRKGFTPVVDQEVRIAQGSMATLIFGGHIISIDQVYEAQDPANVAYDCLCTDYTRLLNRRKVNRRFVGQSATTIITTLVSEFTAGFTSAHVATGLPSIDEIEFTMEDVGGALTRVAQLVNCSWYVDYSRDVHFFVTETTDAPDDLVVGARFANFARSSDASQIRTRVLVEGGGSTTPIDVPAGQTTLPVNDGSWYSASGGSVKAGPQRINYTGLDPAGTGAIIGTGIAAPSNALTAVAKAGSGMGTGAYKWKTTFGTAVGETLAGPASASIAIGDPIPRPADGMTAAKDWGGNLGTGLYRYKVTFVDSAGNETDGNGNSTDITLDAVSAPANIPAGFLASGPPTPSSMSSGKSYRYKYTFAHATTSGIETLPSPASNSIVITEAPPGTVYGGYMPITTGGLDAPPSGFVRRFYRTVGDGSTYLRMSGPVEGWSQNYSSNGLPPYSHYADVQADAALGAAAPSSSSAYYGKVNLANIPTSSDANVVARKIYRTTVNGSTLKLLTTINNNTTTTYADNIADGSLGATIPSANGTHKNQAALTNIPVSPDPAVTSRKLYRTAANPPASGPGSEFRYLTTLANNTTTTYTDTNADGVLGAAEPTADTSGMTGAEGQVVAGTSTIPVSSTTPFASSGGWARIGSQVISYSGKTTTTLTGVPATGTGMLLASVRYGQEILAVPFLKGIPASGAGAVLYPLLPGDDVNVLVQRDDMAAQAALAAVEGGDGVHEHFIQDRRLSIASCEERGDAELAQYNVAEERVTFTSFDLKLRSGKTITVNLPAPTNLSGDFKIQQVTLSQFGIPKQYALRTVTASNVLYRLDTLFRRVLVGT